MAKVETLQQLLVEELEDIYNAERQLLNALPRVAECASSVELRRALERHLSQTTAHVQRLDRIFHDLQQEPRGRKSRGMEALLDEGKSLLDREGDEDVLDAALIAAVQRIEHFEIASYATACAHARAIGLESAVHLLEETLGEEEAAEHLLSRLSAGGLDAMATYADARAEVPVRYSA